jgi:hypothetical protein
MSLASLLILRGGTPKVSDALLIAGVALALVVLALSLYLAFAPWPGHPRRREMYWAIAGATFFYIAAAGAAALDGPEYAVAALAAGVIPLSALALIVATARAKTLAGERLRDASAAAHDDPYPGVGADEETPMGHTPEHSHDDAEETWLDRQPWRRTRARPP